jgi:ankyrin repeat protein
MFILIRAVQYGYYDRVFELIESDPSLASTAVNGNITLLHWAAINNRLEIAKYLINKGADIDMLGGELNSTPLHWAVRDGKLQMVIFLLSRQAQVSLFDSEGKEIPKEFCLKEIFFEQVFHVYISLVCLVIQILLHI